MTTVGRAGPRSGATWTGAGAAVAASVFVSIGWTRAIGVLNIAFSGGQLGIVIGPLPEFRFSGEVDRVAYAAVKLVRLVMVRVTRLAYNNAPGWSYAAQSVLPRRCAA